MKYQVEDRLTKKIVRCEQNKILDNVITTTDCYTGDLLGITEELLDGKVIKSVHVNGNVGIVSTGTAVDNLQPGMVTSGMMAFGTQQGKIGEIPVTARAWRKNNEIIREIILSNGKIIYRNGYTSNNKIPDWSEEIERESATSRRIIFWETARRIQ